MGHRSGPLDSSLKQMAAMVPKVPHEEWGVPVKPDWTYTTPYTTSHTTPQATSYSGANLMSLTTTGGQT